MRWVREFNYSTSPDFGSCKLPATNQRQSFTHLKALNAGGHRFQLENSPPQTASLRTITMPDLDRPPRTCQGRDRTLRPEQLSPFPADWPGPVNAYRRRINNDPHRQSSILRAGQSVIPVDVGRREDVQGTEEAPEP